MADTKNWNGPIIEEFRANGGKVGGPYEHQPLLLLHHRGARSEVERVNPLAYQRVGDSYAVFATKGGSPTNPDWYHNIVANPRVKVEVGTEAFHVNARVARGGSASASGRSKRDSIRASRTTRRRPSVRSP